MNPKYSIKDLLDKGDYDNICEIICNTENLEDLKLFSYLAKIFNCLSNKLKYEKITDILLTLSKYKKDNFNYEIREGIKLLLSHL